MCLYIIHKYITKLQLDYTNSQSYQELGTLTSIQGLPRLRLTNLKRPTSNIPSRFCLSPIGSRENVSNMTSFACGLLAVWATASPTHNQRNSSLHG